MRRVGPIAVTAVTETVATLRSAAWPVAMLRPLPRPRPGHHPPVVLVHGFLGHPAMWRPLIRRLYRRGHHRVATVGYPSTRRTLPQIVDAIHEVVVAQGEQVVLVGHSLGAVACRAYVKAFDGAENVLRLVSVGGPHAGTALYRLAPPGLRDVLAPDSVWVKRLAEGEEPVPTVVVRARYDHQVLPPVRARLHGVSEVVIERHGHNGLLWHKAAHAAIMDAIEGRS
jgi:triacylglycerol lipase